MGCGCGGGKKKPAPAPVVKAAIKKQQAKWPATWNGEETS